MPFRTFTWQNGTVVLGDRIAIVLVWLVDVGESLAASLRKTPGGEDRPFELPSLTTTGSRV
jgi:hypothetical protein